MQALGTVNRTFRAEAIRAIHQQHDADEQRLCHRVIELLSITDESQLMDEITEVFHKYYYQSNTAVHPGFREKIRTTFLITGLLNTFAELLDRADWNKLGAYNLNCAFTTSLYEPASQPSPFYQDDQDSYPPPERSSYLKSVGWLPEFLQNYASNATWINELTLAEQDTEIHSIESEQLLKRIPQATFNHWHSNYSVVTLALFLRYQSQMPTLLQPWFTCAMLGAPSPESRYLVMSPLSTAAEQSQLNRAICEDLGGLATTSDESDPTLDLLRHNLADGFQSWEEAARWLMAITNPTLRLRALDNLLKPQECIIRLQGAARVVERVITETLQAPSISEMLQTPPKHPDRQAPEGDLAAATIITRVIYLYMLILRDQGGPMAVQEALTRLSESAPEGARPLLLMSYIGASEQFDDTLEISEEGASAEILSESMKLLGLEAPSLED